MLKQTLLILATSILLSACGKGGVSDFAAPENTPVAELFEKGCAKCHGSDGGGMLFGLMFTLAPQEQSAEQLASTILSGREKMPAFAALSQKQRLELANHILKIRQ